VLGASPLSKRPKIAQGYLESLEEGEEGESEPEKALATPSDMGFM
jgi:hypothetical protein